MNSTIQFKMPCPVCSRTANLPGDTYCPDCGWKFLLYSGHPGEALTLRLQTHCQLKQKRHSQFQELVREEQNYRQKIKEIEPHHQIQKENYDQVQPEYDFLVQQLEIEKQSTVLKEVELLERQVRECQLQLDKIIAKIPLGYQNHKRLKVAFSCHYNRNNNQLELTVDEVFDHIGSINLDIVFAVAFFQRPWDSFHDAELIIPTNSKRVKFFNLGDKFFLDLKYSPQNHLLQANFYQTIHLTIDSLSEFIIK